MTHAHRYLLLLLLFLLLLILLLILLILLLFLHLLFFFHVLLHGHILLHTHVLLFLHILLRTHVLLLAHLTPIAHDLRNRCVQRMGLHRLALDVQRRAAHAGPRQTHHHSCRSAVIQAVRQKDPLPNIALQILLVDREVRRRDLLRRHLYRFEEELFRHRFSDDFA